MSTTFPLLAGLATLVVSLLMAEWLRRIINGMRPGTFPAATFWIGTGLVLVALVGVFFWNLLFLS